MLLAFLSLWFFAQQQMKLLSSLRLSLQRALRRFGEVVTSFRFHNRMENARVDDWEEGRVSIKPNDDVTSQANTNAAVDFPQEPERRGVASMSIAESSGKIDPLARTSGAGDQARSTTFAVQPKSTGSGDRCDVLSTDSSDGGAIQVDAQSVMGRGNHGDLAGSTGAPNALQDEGGRASHGSGQSLVSFPSPHSRDSG